MAFPSSPIDLVRVAGSSQTARRRPRVAGTSMSSGANYVREHDDGLVVGTTSLRHIAPERARDGDVERAGRRERDVP